VSSWRAATFEADGVRLGDLLGDGEQLRHRFPGFAGVVLIQTATVPAENSAALRERRQEWLAFSRSCLRRIPICLTPTSEGF
jgi:hypothetical protein